MGMRPASALAAFAGLAAASAAGLAPAWAELVDIPAGQMRPLYTASDADGRVADDAKVADVAAFQMERHAVTNADFLRFTVEHPQWRRSAAKRLLADSNYLSHWEGDARLGPRSPPDSPVVNVSWFAAKQYCESLGMSLPTVAQWEYVGAASESLRDASDDTEHLRTVVDWYQRPAEPVLPSVRDGITNAFGITGMHQGIWEWTLDFNTALVTGDSRGDTSLDRQQFCGSGSVGAADFGDYAAFLRYAMRSSLDGRHTVGSLGFRCVRNVAATSS